MTKKERVIETNKQNPFVRRRTSRRVKGGVNTDRIDYDFTHESVV